MNVFDNAKTASRNTAPIVDTLMRNAVIVVRANASLSLRNATFVRRNVARIASNSVRNVVNQCAKDVFQKELNAQVVNQKFVKIVANRNAKHANRNGVKTARLTTLCVLGVRIKHAKAALVNAINVWITHVRSAFGSAKDATDQYAQDVHIKNIVMDVIAILALIVSNNVQHAKQDIVTTVQTLELNAANATSKLARNVTELFNVQDVIRIFVLIVAKNVRHANRKSAKNVQILKLNVLSATSWLAKAATKSARNANVNFVKYAFLKAVNAKDVTSQFVLIALSLNANHAHHYCALIMKFQKTNAIDAVSRYVIIVVLSVANVTNTFVTNAIITIVNVPNATNISVMIASRVALRVREKFAVNVQIQETNASHATSIHVNNALGNAANAAKHSVLSAFQMVQNVKVVITISVLIVALNAHLVKERCAMTA
ncbi:MAG: hypothetical protein EZS28_005946 [Streblomastix strix]|uniref:Uncharacterized protein n=1 Tax=Streblomastix strix TaxID=222440 RepID=A0A5J4WVE1_9EUKA|nr:MAG: hypothetical protein EZS28_005946 [Streblomastix strix]